MSTINLKNLGIGSLTSIPSSLYLVPASTSALVKSITLVNSSSANAATVNLAISSGTTSAYILPPAYSLDASGMLACETSNITLGPGASISGWSSIANIIQYVINGVEEA